MTLSHIALTPDLFLVRQEIQQERPSSAPVPVDHLVLVDCSYSMAYDLPKVREQLHRRLPALLGESDTLTLIWFSGRGECGIIIDAEPVAGVKDLQSVNKRIDRWLKPVGMTGFKEPLLAASEVVDRLCKARRDQSRQISLFFMSDGQDNQWPREANLQVLSRLQARLGAATFVEFGMHADRRMLAAMAQAAGGIHLFTEGFESYEPAFEQAIQRRPPSQPRKEVGLAAAPVGGFVFELADEIVTYEASLTALVSPEAAAVYYLTVTRPPKSKAITVMGDLTRANQQQLRIAARSLPSIATALYGALSLFATRMQPEIIFPLLRTTGDVRLIRMFSTCFGKQHYTKFMETARLAALDPDERLLEGYDPGRVLPDDAFTIFHLLELLQSDESTRVLLDHPAFRYSRISRRRVDADETLTIEEQGQLDEIRSRMAKTRNAKELKALQTEIDTIIATKREALKFIADPAPDGYAIEALKFHETQPNISILVRKTGTIDLTRRADGMPESVREALGKDCWAIPAFKTHIWRNYALIANGLVNVSTLPVKISPTIWNKLAAHGVCLEELEGGITLLCLDSLPILNRAMVGSVRMHDAVQLEFELERSAAFQKVFKDVVQNAYPDAKLAGLAERYGEGGAQWLREQGITDGGFAPRTTVAESVDYITGRELVIKLAGFSKLPKVDDVRAKLKRAGDPKVKLNGPETLMAEALREVDAIIAKHAQHAAATNEALGVTAEKLKRALIERQQALVTERRALLFRAARMKFAITVGQTWFREFTSIEQNTLEMELPLFGRVKATAELREFQIPI